MRTPSLFVILLGLIAQAQDPTDLRLRALQLEAAQLETQRQALLPRLEQAKLAVMQRDLSAQGLPALSPGEEVITHPGHSLVWSAEHQQPKWTAHIVTHDIMSGNLARIDTFLPDPEVFGSDLFSNYWNSGYDRGHMVPSADMRWSKDAMVATYYYSNISPQRPELNRGTWAELEDWGRRYVHYSGERVFVVTGPVFANGLPQLPSVSGKEHVSVPKFFFKALADLDGDDVKGIAFVMQNGVNDGPPISYAVSIDSVEKITGLDLFASVSDEVEVRIEAMHVIKPWQAQGDPFFGEVAPLKAPLPKGMYNTVQARYHVGNTVTICGTVVNTRRTQKANAIYLNLDRMHPHQDFYATVWDFNGPNFSYDPETALTGKAVCVTGKVTLYDDIPRISINNENEITLWRGEAP